MWLLMKGSICQYVRSFENYQFVACTTGVVVGKCHLYHTHWVRCGGEDFLLVSLMLGPLLWRKSVDLLLVPHTLGPLWWGKKC